MSHIQRISLGRQIQGPSAVTTDIFNAQSLVVSADVLYQESEKMGVADYGVAFIASNVSDGTMPFVNVYIADGTPKAITLQFDSSAGIFFDSPIYLTANGVEVKTCYVRKTVTTLSTITMQAVWRPSAAYHGKNVALSFRKDASRLRGTNITLEVA